MGNPDREFPKHWYFVRLLDSWKEGYWTSKLYFFIQYTTGIHRYDFISNNSIRCLKKNPMADCQRGHRHKVYNPPRRITIYFLYVVEQEAPFSLSLQFFSLLSLSTTNMSNVFSKLCSKQFQTKKKSITRRRQTPNFRCRKYMYLFVVRMPKYVQFHYWVRFHY